MYIFVANDLIYYIIPVMLVKQKYKRMKKRRVKYISVLTKPYKSGIKFRLKL